VIAAFGAGAIGTRAFPETQCLLRTAEGPEKNCNRLIGESWRSRATRGGTPGGLELGV